MAAQDGGPERSPVRPHEGAASGAPMSDDTHETVRPKGKVRGAVWSLGLARSVVLRPTPREMAEMRELKMYSIRPWLRLGCLTLALGCGDDSQGVGEVIERPLGQSNLLAPGAPPGSVPGK